MSLQKLAEYCDRRSEAENATNSLQRMYWLQSRYYDKKWRLEICRCFWSGEYEVECNDGSMQTVEAGWGHAYKAYTLTRDIALEAEGDTEEEAIQHLEEILGL